MCMKNEGTQFSHRPDWCLSQKVFNILAIYGNLSKGTGYNNAHILRLHSFIRDVVNQREEYTLDG